MELECPFTEKDVAKGRGAFWSRSRKKWAARKGAPLRPFKRRLALPKGCPKPELPNAAPAAPTATPATTTPAKRGFNANSLEAEVAALQRTVADMQAMVVDAHRIVYVMQAGWGAQRCLCGGAKSGDAPSCAACIETAEEA